MRFNIVIILISFILILVGIDAVQGYKRIDSIKIGKRTVGEIGDYVFTKSRGKGMWRE